MSNYTYQTFGYAAISFCGAEKEVRVVPSYQRRSSSKPRVRSGPPIVGVGLYGS